MRFETSQSPAARLVRNSNASHREHACLDADDSSPLQYFHQPRVSNAFRPSTRLLTATDAADALRDVSLLVRIIVSPASAAADSSISLTTSPPSERYSTSLGFTSSVLSSTSISSRTCIT